MINALCKFDVYFGFFFLPMIIALDGPMNSVDRWSLPVVFSLLIQFNAFLVCLLFIPSQCHLFAFCSLIMNLTVFVCHGRWWIRFYMELSPSEVEWIEVRAHTSKTSRVDELIMIRDFKPDYATFIFRRAPTECNLCKLNKTCN